jgi:RimJ/RimL family protein N-acetyltransferase
MLRTERLILRPFRRTDAAEFARLAGEWAVAAMTSDIPHPFTQKQAIAWLKPVRGEVRFAVQREGRLVGGVGFYRRPSGVAEIGFWLGRPWWGHGYATEATWAVVQYGVRNRNLPGFSSAHFVDNPASGRVLLKLGFQPAGRGYIACTARGYDVEAITYWLDRHRASAFHTRQEQASRSRWRVWLDRLAPN